MGKDHVIIIVVTVICGLMTLAFMVAQSLLFQNPDSKGSLPWRGLPSRIMLLKLALKLSTVLYMF